MSTPEQSDSTDVVGDLGTFLRRYYHEDIGQLAGRFPREQRSLTIEYGDLFQYSPEIAEDLAEAPDTIIGYLEEALAQYDLPAPIDLDGATVRVTGMNDLRTYSVGEYRSNQISEYISIHGQVAKTSPVQPRPLVIHYTCLRCGGTTELRQTGTGIQEPSECQYCERQGPWRFLKDQSQFVDHQLLRVQQPPEETKGGQGEFIDVHLEEDLVGEVQPGDRVYMSGTLDIEEPSDGSTTFTPFLKGRAAEVEETDYEEIEVSKHKDRIQELAAGEEGDPYDLLMESIAPKIRGHDTIKEAIILQLFGGVRMVHPNGSVDRGDSHILLLGDPGTAKSSLLRAVEEIAPRSAYASGKGASAAGMTAAAVPDDFGEQKWSLEAGALVLANKGIACVDEIDKIDDTAVSSMHDALESQRVTVNKAGINATLPAQTAVLAAGNPEYGRFDQYESLAEQIELPPTLMSRFDLMFLLRDKPEEERDREIAGHMIETRQLANKYTNPEETLTEEELAAIEPPIEADVLRAYIAYAKQNVSPRVVDDQIAIDLREQFVDLRLVNDGEGDHPVPVTMRKLEAVQRLAEASARVRLSNTVERQDVERAHRLVLASMQDVGLDPESGEMDVDIVETGNSKAQRDRRKLLRQVIQDLEDAESGAAVDEVVEIMTKKGFTESSIRHDIKVLCTEEGKAYHPDSAQAFIRYLD